jgi:hypothetical protein
LLGQLEDEFLAQLLTTHFGITITAPLVAAIRDDLDVSAYTARKPKLEPHIRELVGRYSSLNIAKGWDVSAHAVEAYRQLAKIEALAAVQDDLPVSGRWKKEWIELFPRHTNAQIARATGIPIDSVRAKRKSLRIAAPVGRTYWRLVSANELETMTDEQLASQHGGPTADYAAQRLSKVLQDKELASRVLEARKLPDELVPFLNKMPTRRLAKLTGLSDFHLGRQRRALGIEAYTPMSPELDALLATCPDTAIAETFHVAVATVKSRRDKLGKPAFKPQSRKSKRS